MNTNLGVLWPQVVNISETGAMPFGLLKLGDFARRTAMSAAINLLVGEGKAQVLTNPKVLVASGYKAKFEVGGRIPLPVANFQGITMQYKPAVMSFVVTPEVFSNGSIGANFDLTIDNFDYSQTVQTPNGTLPTVTHRSLESSLAIKSGETVVMGGFKQNTYTQSTTRVPFLGSIPMLGKLFSSTQMKKQDSTIYIFLTMEKVK